MPQMRAAQVTRGHDALSEVYRWSGWTGEREPELRDLNYGTKLRDLNSGTCKA